MIEYAKVSQMIEFARAGIWPLGRQAAPLGRRLRDIAKIILNLGPVTTPYGGSKGMRGLSRLFRMGTRGWEYPWALQQLQSLPPGSAVLDCGCGESGFPLELHRRGFKVTGLDFIWRPAGRYAGYGIRPSHIGNLKGKVEFVDGSMHNIP